MALQGSQPLAVLLCKFADTPEIEPQPTSYYQDLVSNRGTGGLNDYWADASMGAIDLDGSMVFGWKVLGSTRSNFLAAHPGRWDKIKGAIDAFSEVDTSRFKAVVAVFNVDVTDGGAQGGVLAQPGDANATFLGHETGHLFGLEHSFDASVRLLETWSAPGEYFDRHDLMSAMNVHADTGHRFSPRGPLLNIPNLDRMGWLPPARVWSSSSPNSSSSFDVDIVALGHPEVDGFLAAHVGNAWIEFRVQDRWDRGLPYPTVLIHRAAEPNSYLVPSDAANNVSEWQPGQVFGPDPLDFTINGGTRVTIVSFDLQRPSARIRVQIRATRRFQTGPSRFIGGVESGGGGILIMPSGKIVPVPPRSPLMELAERVDDQRDLAVELALRTVGVNQEPGLNTRFRGV
jgi:hypothetical protein